MVQCSLNCKQVMAFDRAMCCESRKLWRLHIAALGCFAAET